jgi:NAD-dependent DNA ligase
MHVAITADCGGSVELLVECEGPIASKLAPTLKWVDRVFLFTGVMAYGPRKECESLIVERGGLIGGSVSRKTNYLVVGSIGNDQWLHSTYGTKIKKAVELRENGVPIAIISEEHWQRVLFG